MLRFPEHFDEQQVRDASQGALPPVAYEANAQRVLDWLEAARVYLDRPIIITGFGRTPEHNAEIAGAATNSEHMYWLGVDFDVVGMTNHEAAAALIGAQQEGAVPPYHQIITYETDGHVHVGLAGMQWLADLQALVKTASGKYVLFTQQKAAQLGAVIRDDPSKAALYGVIALAFFFPTLAAVAPLI